MLQKLAFQLFLVPLTVAFWNNLHSSFKSDICFDLQFSKMNTDQLLHKPYHFERAKTTLKILPAPWIYAIFLKRGLDLSILKIWGLLVKGLQSYQLSKLEVTRKSLPTSPGPSRTSLPRFEPGRSRIILKVWWPVTLQPFALQTPNFHHWKF